MCWAELFVVVVVVEILCINDSFQVGCCLFALLFC